MANEPDEQDEVRRDEIFALCEIFSDSCRKESDSVITFDIREPEFGEKKVQLQVRFIESYPRCSKPESTLTADWLPGELIKQIDDKLDQVWQENLNQPVVFLWLEAVKEAVLKWLEDEGDLSGENPGEEESNVSDDLNASDDLNEIDQDFSQLNMSKDYKKKDQNSSDHKEETFAFHHGEPLVVKKSVFQAHLLHIDDESKIPAARKYLASISKRVAEATHNIMAYRIIKTLDNRTIELSNYDDDGETQAGGRLHLLLQLTDSKNVLVVVSRYFGGVKLGPDRFKFINEVAKILLQEQGVVCPKEGGKQKGKKKK